METMDNMDNMDNVYHMDSPNPRENLEVED